MILARIIDAGIVILGVWLTEHFYDIHWSKPDIILTMFIPVPIFLYVANMNRLYASWRAANIKDELVKVGIIWTTTYVLMVGMVLFLKMFKVLPRLVLLGWFIVPMLLLMVWHITFRLGLRSIRGVGWNFHKVAIIGAGQLGCELATKINSAPWMGFNLIGFFDDKMPIGTKPIDNMDLAVVGRPENLITNNSTQRVDRVYITLPLKAEDRIKELIASFMETTTAVYWVPNYFTFDLLHSQMADVDGLTTISIFESPFYGIDSWVKRLEDLILGSLILLLITIPMIIIALSVKFTSRGPVLYKQKRYGFNGKEFIVWKFRTMTVTETDDDVRQATRNDDRVTWVGKFLRRTSLDELPQFINVLQGRMSIVGPRPHPVRLDEQYRKTIFGYMLRHRVKPGITGWAQVNGWRGETDTQDKMERRLEHDLHYIRNWSLAFDLKIIFLTILKGFTSANAY